MNCQHCGAAINPGNQFCANCGAATTPAAPGPAPLQYASRPQGYSADVPNYLAQAILCTIFCCLPFGIVAIVFAAQVNSKLSVGDYQGAANASNSAKTWCWAAFLCGFIPMVLWILLICAGGVFHRATFVPHPMFH